MHAVQVTQRDTNQKYAVMQSTAGYYGHVAIVEKFTIVEALKSQSIIIMFL